MLLVITCCCRRRRRRSLKRDFDGPVSGDPHAWFADSEDVAALVEVESRIVSFNTIVNVIKHNTTDVTNVLTHAHTELKLTANGNGGWFGWQPKHSNAFHLDVALQRSVVVGSSVGNYQCLTASDGTEAASGESSGDVAVKSS